MRHKIILKEDKLVIKFKNNKGNINKSIICHIRDTLSLWYGRIKVDEYPHGVNPKRINVTLTTVGKKPEEIHYILKSAKRFLEDFLISEAVNKCSCSKCNIKKRPVFCVHNICANKIHNKNRIAV